MRRFSGLLVMGAAALFCLDGVSAWAAPAPKAIELTLGHPTQRDSTWHAAAVKFKELVEKRTDNRVKINIFPAGELGNERELAEQLQSRAIDLTLVSTMTMSSFEPSVQIFDFPYLFPTHEKAYAVLDGKVGNLVAEILKKKNFHVLAYMENEYRGISNSKRPVNVPADLKGMKMRVPEAPVLAKWLESLGSAPTPIPSTELYTALQTGIVDGQDNGIILTYSHKVASVQKYYSITNHIYGNLPIFINEQRWQSLPPDIQDIIQKAAYETRDYERKISAEYRAKYLAEMKKMGVIVNDITPENMKLFIQSARVLYPSFKKMVDPAVYDAAMEAIKD